jgi:D-isomer specific 2-hydroxyacid dehydrogenase NAD-binding
VLSSEPPPPDNPLLSAPNCHITPHNAWTTFAARKRLVRIAFDNLASWQNGRKKNVVNP